ncbi:M20/M25/M40 family metallo-hydrolase [uncultured Dokdonia sp.]|uniref:M20/M25/M40 family metallo-hydrolase n=1 Tax=uncultured Dokdonia sp. TaxID=575653 RepID=UPI0026320D25|nr:M20/M25/M40 family metallo-hydrolase [uncultured Dokdonia sp.]
MKKNLIFLLVVLCVGYIGYAQSFDETQLLERLKTLSSDTYEGRRTGEKGNMLARAYIIKTFKELDIAPFGSRYEHPFTFEAREEVFNATNVLAHVKGTVYPNTYIVVSAHYDHLGVKDGVIYNGADDDASGIAALFSFAEYLTKNPPKHTVILAAFDAEELGLQGAHYFVDKMKDANILVNLNMDMISRSVKDELYVVGTPHNKKLKAIIDTFENPTSSKVLIGHDGNDDQQDWTTASDHGAFYKEKIPFLYFGNEDHPGYHDPSDDFDDITPAFYKNAVQIILSVFIQIDQSGL